MVFITLLSGNEQQPSNKPEQLIKNDLRTKARKQKNNGRCRYFPRSNNFKQLFQRPQIKGICKCRSKMEKCSPISTSYRRNIRYKEIHFSHKRWRLFTGYVVHLQNFQLESKNVIRVILFLLVTAKENIQIIHEGDIIW